MPNQGTVTVFVITSGIWYHNVAFTACAFSERRDGFLTWADIANAKIGVTEGSVVHVGHATIDVGKSLCGPFSNLLSELQRFFNGSRIWEGTKRFLKYSFKLLMGCYSGLNEESLITSKSLEKEPIQINVVYNEWSGQTKAHWKDGIMLEDLKEDGIKVKADGSDDPKVLPRAVVRPPPPNHPNPAKLREGTTIEFHQPPLWIKARIVRSGDTVGDTRIFLYYLTRISV